MRATLDSLSHFASNLCNILVWQQHQVCTFWGKKKQKNKQKFQRKWWLKLNRHFTNPTPSSQTLRKSLVKKTGKASMVLRRPYLFLTREFTSCSGWSCYCDLSCRFLFFCTVYIVIRLTDTISWSESLLCILYMSRSFATLVTYWGLWRGIVKAVKAINNFTTIKIHLFSILVNDHTQTPQAVSVHKTHSPSKLWW